MMNMKKRTVDLLVVTYFISIVVIYLIEKRVI